jgi:hypothetical protein
MPEKRPAYRANRPHREFITTLSDKVRGIDDMEAAFVKQLKTRFEVIHHADLQFFEQEFSHLSQIDQDSQKPIFQPRSFVEAIE